MKAAKELRRVCANMSRLSSLAEDAHARGDGDALKAFAGQLPAQISRMYAESTTVMQAAGLRRGVKARRKRA